MIHYYFSEFRRKLRLSLNLDKGLKYSQYRYLSYKEYVKIQTFFNKKKINKIWASRNVLDFIIEDVKKTFKNESNFLGVCHGTRNGFEQNYIKDITGWNVIGTEISDTAIKFPNTIEWDFHNEIPEIRNKCQFVYSNSIDHAYDPKAALQVWFNQLTKGGKVYLEISEKHGPGASSLMDPFGVDPNYFEELLTNWFSDLKIEKIDLFNEQVNLPVILFVCSKY